MNELAIGVIGAVAGSAVTLLWDAFLKPRLEARSLAELIASDLSLHARVITQELAKLEAHARTVPLAQPFPLDLYNATVNRMGELPDSVLARVLYTYRGLASLNRYSERANALHSALQDAVAAGQSGEDLDATPLAEAVTTYKLLLTEAKSFINYVQPKLLKAARPFWAPRTWLSERPRTLTTVEVQKDIEATRARHAEEMTRFTGPSA